MSFLITIARPFSGKRKPESEMALKGDGFFYLSELDVWIGEWGGLTGDAWSEIGEFVWDPDYVEEQCKFEGEAFDEGLTETISGHARKELIEMVKAGTRPEFTLRAAAEGGPE